MEARPAWFGFPVYNGEFIGLLKYSEVASPGDECPTCGCTAYGSEEFARFETSDPEEEGREGNIIALIDRGDCNFVEKVYQAQQARAAGVVVVDNQQAGEGWLPIMADDGTGERVQIPSIIISQDDGSRIKQYMTDNPSKRIQVEISWGLPRPDGRVEWELWMPPNPNTTTRKFIQDFEEVMEVLGAHNIDFKPMYKIYNNAQGQMGCSTRCTMTRPIAPMMENTAGRVTGTFKAVTT